MAKSLCFAGILTSFVLLSAGCGGANVIEVLLECRSPDGLVEAVLWVEGGRGLLVGLKI